MDGEDEVVAAVVAAVVVVVVVVEEGVDTECLVFGACSTTDVVKGGVAAVTTLNG